MSNKHLKESEIVFYLLRHQQFLASDCSGTCGGSVPGGFLVDSVFTSTFDCLFYFLRA